MTSTDSDLAAVLGTTETAHVEFKASSKSKDTIAKAICGMANDLANDGAGDVLIGVDDNGRPTGQVTGTDKELLELTDLRDSGQLIGSRR